MDRLISRLADASEVTPAEAADEVDKLIHRIVKKLKHGEAARVPGLGIFEPGREPQFHVEAPHATRRTKTRRTARPNR